MRFCDYRSGRFDMLVSMSDKELKRSSVLQEICDQLLGDKLMARSFPSQVNEIHARVAVLNRFTELGRPHTQVVT